MKKLTITICLLLMLVSGCSLSTDKKIFVEPKPEPNKVPYSTNDRIMTPEAERYYKALKILFQADTPFKKEILADIEYKKYLQSLKNND